MRVSLGGFLLLFVASRLLYVVLLNPGHLFSLPVEDLYRGTIAQELVTGLAMPFADYRADNYAMGSLVIGALAAGFFLLWGPTLFALKLAPLVVFTLALAFWCWTIRRYAGERVAGYFGVLFCFSPPLLTDYSVTAWGYHSESVVFSALTALLLLGMLSQEKPASAYPVLLGLTAGVGLCFAYIYGLTLMAMLVFWHWHDPGMLRRPRVLWFALGFLVGFAPWIIMNLQTNFAGLVIYDKNVWEHFRLEHLWEDLAHPWTLAPVEFLRAIASDDDWDLYRRAANLLYALLYLGPTLTAGVLWLKAGRSKPAGPRPTRLTLVGFVSLSVVVFFLVVQLSDFRSRRYYVPAYPFLFFLTAYSLAYCQDLVPHIRRKIQTVFLTSVVVFGIGAHAPLCSLDQPGYALSAKGYSYAFLPETYSSTHATAGSGDHDFIRRWVLRPFLSAILPKLSPDDQWDLSRAIVWILAEAAPLNGQPEDFARIERVVPAGFDRYFYYEVGAAAIERHPHELSKAIAAVEFLRHRLATSHRLALVGIYRKWARLATHDRALESLVNAPAAMAPELTPHYWRAIGYWAGRSRFVTERSLSRLSADLRSYMLRLDPSAQRAFLQGVGQGLFTRLFFRSRIMRAQIERFFPQAYHQDLFEGWGMALGEFEMYSLVSWKGHESLLWVVSTKGLSARSLAYIQQGKAQFEALFEGPAPSTLEPR